MPSDTPSPFENIAAYSAKDRIDIICDAFEREWREGKRPGIAFYLDNCDAQEQPQLFSELLLVEWELRSRQQDTPTWDDYLTQFPKFSDVIESIRFKHVANNGGEISDNLPPGLQKKIARFELLEELGSGAVGSVWKANDPRLRRLVAIKIPRNPAMSENDMGQFLREARAAAQLRHPGIVGVHEVGRNGGSAYIVSELIQGTDLRSWLEQVKPSSRCAADLCLQIAVALQHAHNQGIVHRDLKPANVLLDAKGIPHIADFGLAKHLSAQSSASASYQVLGTPAYMSPEQARGNSGAVDARSDVYSIGVLLYEMLTGKRPFDGTFDEVLRALLAQEPRRPRQLNREIARDLELICIKAIEKLPSNRYQTAGELGDDLRRFLDGVPIKARRYRITELAWRKVRRQLAITTAILIVTFALGGSAWVWWMAPPTVEPVDAPRMVSLKTDPPGAKVLFVPISQFDGESDPKRAAKAAGVSPIEMKLMPGAYWVEAVLPDGRFHEVVRYVPKSSSVVGGHAAQRAEGGTLSLLPIEIPDNSVTANMIYVPAANGAAFYIDSHVATAADLNAKSRTTNGDERRTYPIVLYSGAQDYAENCGKRLPTNEEWERAQRVLPPRTATDLAEWTSTLELVPDSDGDLILHGLRYRDCRIVRGGSLKLIERKTDLSPIDFAVRNSLPIFTGIVDYSGLGVRCVRSAKPRFLESASLNPQSN